MSNETDRPAPGTPPPSESLATPRVRAPRPEPFDAAYVASIAQRPLRAMDLVLAEPERVGVNVERRVALGGIATVLFLVGALLAIPYGCVLEIDGWWKIVALSMGSTLICLPSLYVFSSYLGQRMSLEQILVLGLMIPAVAAVFSLGFAPILAFLRWTMGDGAVDITWGTISDTLLTLSVLAGIAQLWRTWLASRADRPSSMFALVLLTWHAVFVYVLLRMASVLELAG